MNITKVSIEKWFEFKGISFECPACSNKTFDVGGIIDLPQNIKTPDRGNDKSMIQIYCTNCFYVFLFLKNLIKND